ncbi:MAG TPA: redoxin domain-containing protein [Gemmatimonadales bacterium]|nr:redoxin domain-containing protein [Gemmatimonadales bacterium]
MTLHRPFALLVAIVLLLPAAAVAQEPAPPPTPAGPPTAVLVSGPEIGALAPDISLPWGDRTGPGPVEQPFTVAAHRGSVVVLAFYPQDFTSGCTAEMRQFADRYEEMFGDAVVVGISTDAVESHVRFAQELGLPFKLLSDGRQRAASRYGAKGSEGLNRRIVYVIGKDGKVAYRNSRFDALDPKAYDLLKAAVQSARAAS